jgi:hypothetical protein
LIFKALPDGLQLSARITLVELPEHFYVFEMKRGLANPQPFPDDKQFEGFVSATVGLGKLHAA